MIGALDARGAEKAAAPEMDGLVTGVIHEAATSQHNLFIPGPVKGWGVPCSSDLSAMAPRWGVGGLGGRVRDGEKGRGAPPPQLRREAVNGGEESIFVNVLIKSPLRWLDLQRLLFN
ncbi:unnamed protein product [Pleuronectes platessa]|uniref:Uncharacterized protein n=1 Tax=Pleuronectes platessa TaxID=8262 RepID=A0A9N7TLJ6_PLEPL|nr:unnamed protein product [Pleuronectes platessa]